MALNRIRIYRAEEFDETTEVDPNDSYFDLDGIETTFTLALKTNQRVSYIVQAGPDKYNFNQGGYTKDGTYDFILGEAPTEGVNLLAPGLVYIPFQAYDQLLVDENPSANVNAVAFYVGDNSDDIVTQKYLASEERTGLSLIFEDQIGFGLDNTMMALACATQDGAGDAMTFVTSDVSDITLPEIFAFSTVCVASVATDTVLTLGEEAEVADFQAGFYIKIDPGGVHEETTKVLAVNGSDVTVTATNYDHDLGELVFHTVTKCWGQVTIPEDFTSGGAENYRNMGLRVRGKIESRF